MGPTLFLLSHFIPRRFLSQDLRQGQTLNPTSRFLTDYGIDSDARLDHRPHLFRFHASGRRWHTKPPSTFLIGDRHLGRFLSPSLFILLFLPIIVLPVLRYNHILF